MLARRSAVANASVPDSVHKAFVAAVLPPPDHSSLVSPKCRGGAQAEAGSSEATPPLTHLWSVPCCWSQHTSVRP